MGAWDWQSWAVAAWVGLIAGLLRFVNLQLPPIKVFDEIYYATEGKELLDHGVEWRQVTDAAGNVTQQYGDFVVHPPLGKWIIAIGIKLFGEDATGTRAAFGWRFMGALLGTISIIVITRVARRMFRSTVLGAAAGLLMALDGFHLVLSRTAILDIFVLVFVVFAFGCLILDRDWQRRRWLRLMESGFDPTGTRRPRLTWASIPWWRLATAVMLGAGCGVKWSVAWYVPVFAALMLYWDISVRRTVGCKHPVIDGLLSWTGWAFAGGALVLLTYLSTWTGWFLTDDGWKRHYLQNELHGHEYPVIGALYNLLAYHMDVLKFHEGLSSPHVYQSWPWQWLILGRPVAFYWNADPRCGAAQCAAEIVLLGTPLLWWAFLPALVAMTWIGISRRDWRVVPLLAGAATGIVPWFRYELSHRTMFFFYAAPAEPFLVMSVVYVLGALINGPGVGREGGGRVRTAFSLPSEDRRLYGIVAAAAFIVLVAACFWWYYPLFVGNSIPNSDWVKRMLLGNRWI